MKARRILHAAAAVLVAAAIGEWMWCNHLRAVRGTAQVALEHRLAVLNAQETALRRRMASAASMPVSGSKVKSASPSKALGSPYALLQNSLPLQAAYFAGKRAGVAAAYGPLIRALHLSSAQAVRLAQLIADREERSFDAAASSPRLFKAMTTFDGTDHPRLVIDPYDAESYSAGRVQPLKLPGALDVAAATLVQQSADAFRGAATDLLGAGGFAQLEAYERILPVQATARDLAAGLALTSAPLTVAQADRLVQLLAEATPTYQSGGDATPQQIDWDHVSGTLRTLLSPTQLADLRYTLDYNLNSQHWQQLQRDFFKASPSR